jgi:hypothetical protein
MNNKVVVSQLGARMHYAVPKIFGSHGRLAHFYTDICATKGWPRVLKFLPRGVLPASIKRLVGRQPKDIPADMITVFSGFGLQSAIRRMKSTDVVSETSHALWAGARFSQLVAGQGFHGAAGLYAFSGDALEQMQAAKREGLWTAVEQMIAPREIVERLIDQEAARYPAWAGQQTTNGYASVFAEREKAEWAIADAIICPSRFVRDHVVACGGPAERCVVVPYGVSAPVGLERTNRMPGPLKVLTVGEVGLRKGSPYVVEAARLVGRSAVFRMAGRTLLPAALQKEISEWVTLRGIIPRADIGEELRWADVFLLPSICEGSATAVYEALAAGLPVITTENTGSVVQDGVEGFIVPAGSATDVAHAVERLASDDNLRSEMSRNALNRAADFTVEKYGTRLLAAISQLRIS